MSSLNYATKMESTTTEVQYKSSLKMNKYAEFILSHTISKDSNSTQSPTHTRIGNESMGIFSGKYNIPDDQLSKFFELYYEEIFVNNRIEHLTEKQLEKNGPILIDLDFRFAMETRERIYNEDHIEDLIELYLSKLKDIFQFDDENKFDIFVFEKDSFSRVVEKNVVKDGIHMIIGLQADHVTQQILRKQIISELEVMWEDMPITNTWEDVLDIGISKGKVNWQVYGSRKPGGEPYKLTKVYEVAFDSSDEEFSRVKIPLNKFDLKKNIMKLSARNPDNLSLFYKNEFINVRESAIANKEVDTDNSSNTKSNKNSSPPNSGISSSSIFQIKSHAELENYMKVYIDELTNNSSDYELRETYEYTMTLPEQYYGRNSFLKWVRVGWALRNISDKLFPVWVAFSAQSEEFSFSDIPDLYDKWIKFDMNNPNGLTKRSIMHWSRIDAKEKYTKVRANSIDYYIDETLNISNRDLDDKRSALKGCGDFDLATVLHQLFKDVYVCVSVKNNIWYMYKKHRWIEVDSGTGLRKSISVELREIYRRKVAKIMELQGRETDETKGKILKMKSDKILDICLRLSRTNDKKNIMTEAKELFYDGNFLQKLDTNPYLLCFNNGVIDFKEKVFRRGYPEDCISKSTGIDYKELSHTRDKKIIDEIHDFMYKLFPPEELRRYMWEHLASTLIGTSMNQTFNMYMGGGSNGKSVLVDLMKLGLGEYKADVPLSIITDKRTKIGGLAPEIVDLKGARYAVMQEPQKGDKINEGMMKQLTSGLDPIQARAPYMPHPITFNPQFKLVVCSNTFLEIKSQDHGTWRRIRVVPFLSLFTKNPVEGDPDKPYQFMAVEDINEKFNEWKEVWMAMLVEKAFATNGVVKDCDIVIQSSNSYRESQDYIAEFIADKTIVDPAGTITKTELTSEFTLWYQGTYGRGGPSIKDVQDYMDKKFGKFDKHKCWKGVKINYEKESVMNENETEQELDDDIGEIDGNNL
jgi:P4 family phage/plasmid primase-like protien